MTLPRTIVAGMLVAGIAGLAACTAAGGASQSSSNTTTIFEGARLITADGTPLENSAFIVENHRFTQVGRAGEVPAPANAARVNLAGKTVMPAFVDLHSHVGFENATTATEEKENYTRENLIDHLERYAFSGHALTMSLGSDLPDDFVWQVRDESRGDGFMGARFFTVGRGLAWPGTGPVELSRNDTAYPIVSTWQARMAVRELAARKVPFVKLWLEDRGGYELPDDSKKRDQLVAEHGFPRANRPYQLTPEIYRAAIDEAKKLKVRTLAHVKTREDLKDMIRAGIDGWTHPIGDLAVDDELVALLKERPNLWYIPAITPAGAGGSAPRAAGQRPAWLSDPLLGAIKCPAYLEQWGRSFETNSRVPPSTGGLGVENVAALHKAGVKIVLGSHDAGGNRVIGWGTHMELEAFVNWVGMTTRETLVSATSLAAVALGVEDEVGSIAPGRSADFIVLDANPLDDITNTRRISQVFLHGNELERPALKARWRSACDASSVTRTQ